MVAPSFSITWLTCFLTVSMLTTSCVAMAWLDWPAAIMVSGLCQQQPGAVLHLVVGQQVQPAPDRGALTPEVVERVKVLFDQPRRPGRLPAGHRVVDGVVGQAAVLVPGRGPLVQVVGLAGVLSEAGAQQVGEQMVVAPPAPNIIEGNQEQAGSFHLLEPGLAIAAARDRVTQRTAETVE